jgi:hypothetical protein
MWDAPNTGTIIDHPLRRLSRAISELRDYDQTLGIIAAEEVLLLLWLVHQRNAHEFLPRVCEFQGMLWDLTSFECPDAFARRQMLADAFDERFLMLGRAALGVIKASSQKLELVSTPAGLALEAEEVRIAKRIADNKIAARVCGVLKQLRGLSDEFISAQQAEAVGLPRRTLHSAAIGWQPEDRRGRQTGRATFRKERVIGFVIDHWAPKRVRAKQDRPSAR